MINIVYPYINSGWDELRYSLRSLEQHLKEDFEVTVIGDYEPPWMTNVNFIRTPRYTPAGKDTGSKLRLCTLIFDDFVWMNDDIYLTQDTALDELKVIRAKELYSDKSHKGATEWIRRANASYAAVKQEFPEKTLFNYVTHAPFYLESKKLVGVDKATPIFNGTFDAIICYFNITGPERPRKLTGQFTFPVPFVPPVGAYKYMNHAENALTPQAKEYLQMRFYQPSKYEADKPAELTFKACVTYLGSKQNFVYGRHDFTKGYAYMNADQAQKLVASSPRTFALG